MAPAFGASSSLFLQTLRVLPVKPLPPLLFNLGLFRKVVAFFNSLYLIPFYPAGS